MPSTEELHSHGDVALNEADVLDIRVDPTGREARLLIRVLTLPEVGPEPADRRVVLVLRRIGRIVASMRHGRWDDQEAEVEALTLEQLSPTLRSFGGSAIYGWSFFDTSSESRAHWFHRLSLDVTFDSDASEHSLAVFQEPAQGPDRILDLCIWFNDLTVLDSRGSEIPLQEFGDGARRWWAAMRARDPRVGGHGVVPAGPWPSSADDPPRE